MRRIQGPRGIPCLKVRYDTPEYTLTGAAATANEINSQFAAMSWMDSVLNVATFAMTWTQQQLQNNPDLQGTVWVAQNQRAMHDDYTSPTSWSDFQKKMGFASWCCLKQDSEALLAQPLCYRNDETKRTMLMVALLIDELDYEDSCKFREMYKVQLGPGFEGTVGLFNQNIFKQHPIFSQKLVA